LLVHPEPELNREGHKPKHRSRSASETFRFSHNRKNEKNEKNEL
jgi:hypothetical protein